MAIKTIPLSRLETDLKKTLNDCAESGETLVVEMPDHQRLTIQPLDLQEDDSLMDLVVRHLRCRNDYAKSIVGHDRKSLVIHPGNGPLFAECPVRGFPDFSALNKWTSSIACAHAGTSLNIIPLLHITAKSNISRIPHVKAPVSF